MAKPGQIVPRAPLTPQEIEVASYVGSKEHKTVRWWGGLPDARVGPDGKIAKRPKKQLTTVCPLVADTDRIQASAWVRQALSLGRYRFYEGDQTYPKHIRHKDEAGQYWFGFCTNGTSGTYKGWPVEEAEKRETFD